MTTFYLNSNANWEMLQKYCKPHKIDPNNVLSITVEPLSSYQIDYTNKDGHYCTILVYESLSEL